MNSFMLCSKDTVTDAPVVVRKQAENVAPEKKPTPIRKVHWRNKWASDRGFRDGNWRAGPGEWLTHKTYATAELAEQKAQEVLADAVVAVQQCGFRYLGPVFFPAEGEGT